MPDASVRRLSAYLRQLEHLAAAGVDQVSSRQLSEYIKVGAAQVRRDLAIFGQFGQPGRGYLVAKLIDHLRHILGTQQTWRVVLVGAGQLGDALLRYPGFAGRGFELVAAVDCDERKAGARVGNVVVRPLDELEELIRHTDARIAILSIPAAAAQDIANRLVDAGIEGILNFATPVLELPPAVHMEYVDITAHLEQLSFQLVSNHNT